jgi:hypothetical protein
MAMAQDFVVMFYESMYLFVACEHTSQDGLKSD